MSELVPANSIFSRAEDMVERTKNGETVTWCESQKIHLEKDKSLKAIKLLYISEGNHIDSSQQWKPIPTHIIALKNNSFGLFESMGTYCIITVWFYIHWTFWKHKSSFTNNQNRLSLDFLAACPQWSVSHCTPLVAAKGMWCWYEHACEDNVG